MDRRQLIAGAAAGTLIPVAGRAQAVAMASSFQTETLNAESDPFVSAFCRYVEAEEGYIRACNEGDSASMEAHEERVNGLCNASADAMLEMSETVPTSTLGLYLGICALLPVFGELDSKDGEILDFDAMVVRCHHTNGSGEALLRSLRAAADRILNGNDPEEV